MKIKIFPSLLIIIFLIIFVIFYKGLQNSNTYTPNVSIEKNIPIFTVKIFETNNEINSKTIFKSDKFYLVNIWASWCKPCRDEHLFIKTISKNKKIKVIGLNYKDNFINAKKFLNDMGNPYSTILIDKDGTVAINWGAYGVPETFLVYKEKIIKRYIGPLNKEILREIEEIIK